MAKFQEYLKNIFWIILILQFAPSIFRSISKQWSDHVEPKNKVGLVLMNSMICASSNWNKQLTKLFKDPEIKAILIKIDSGGGAAGSSQAIFQEILQLKVQYPKPIVAYAENVCASGAYQIATATDHIVATGSALIGSIGAKFSTLFKLKEFAQNYKIGSHAIASGDCKNCLDLFVDLTDEQKKMLQAMVNDCYEQFAQDVAKQRHLNMTDKNCWAEGKVFTGNEALRLKLIDEVGNQTTAINFIKKQILHADREIEFVRIPGPSRFERWMHPESDEDDDMECRLATSLWQGLFNTLQKSEIRF
ncbi:signal peptide peptidase SppA [Candidatus Babeliales bacterium]|nr:signal peptide peptidase SppA [Candidatus Babeliales bacterium]